MAWEKTTAFVLFLNDNMNIIRTYGMTPDDVYNIADNIWTHMPIQYKIEYVKKEMEINNNKSSILNNYSNSNNRFDIHYSINDVDVNDRDNDFSHPKIA